MNAGRIICGVGNKENLAGLLFISSGLGGMSGAQPKAAEIVGVVSFFALPKMLMIIAISSVVQLLMTYNN